ncbi:uncharacterized protein LOC106129899 [Amyelois transitella]|uniref:uncharacterized protein LOC106129899 n=1 Tax=Amyelois transitella TaxID=680683 RepID=UPI0029901B6E|nr:uncharacterized protein LOC106129899 [Amyelois transitella]
MGKNKTIPSGERTIILRVLHFFEEEKKKGSPLLPLKKALSRTSTATGVSLSTITRIKKEELKIIQEISHTKPQESCSEQTAPTLVSQSRPEVILPTPGKKRGPAHNKMVIDDRTICAIKDIVNNFYKEKNELPTLKKILAVAKANFNFPGQKETLRKILREKCGYTFTKCVRRSDILKGRNEVGFWRARNVKTKEKKQFGKDKKRKKVKIEDLNKTNFDKIENSQSQLNKTINECREIVYEHSKMVNSHSEIVNRHSEMASEMVNNFNKFDNRHSEMGNEQCDNVTGCNEIGIVHSEIGNVHCGMANEHSEIGRYTVNTMKNEQIELRIDKQYVGVEMSMVEY